MIKGEARRAGKGKERRGRRVEKSRREVGRLEIEKSLEEIRRGDEVGRSRG